MVLTDSIILLRNTIDRLSINEALNKGHAPHPEDYVYLAGSSGATEAIQSAIQTITHTMLKLSLLHTLNPAYIQKY